MMAKTLSESAAADIRKTIDGVTSDPNRIPGCVMVVVGKDGKPIFQHASGTRGVETKDPMTLDTIFSIFSCTKMIGGVAAMQLVEQGKLSLDDADMLEKILPELKDMKILKSVDENGKAELVEKKNRITLRMLLSHTSGFGYTFFNPDLRQYTLPTGWDELLGFAKDVERLPLTFEPGTGWQYGTGVDWAGMAVERVSGMSLDEYFKKQIFDPLGLKEMTLFPTDTMKSRLAYMHSKANGKIKGRDHILHRSLIAEGDEIKDVFNSAGAGCFGRPVEYCEILATLLNDGVSPKTGNRILQASTVATMFENQIPNFPNFGRQGIPDAKPEYTNPLPDLYPQPKEQEQGWGLTFMLTIHPTATGRGNNAGFWAGLANLFWWCDREKGVAGMIATQIIPFGDPDVMGLWANVESQIYANT